MGARRCLCAMLEYVHQTVKREIFVNKNFAISFKIKDFAIKI